VVSPLTLPTPDVTSAEALAESASGAFVLHRALEVSPSPTFDEDDARALAELCHRMAGLPLAIELATAHLRLLTPPSLLQRLDHLSALGARDLPPRQQTMRATLDWSYRLLSPDQQTLFRLLGVFRGGATLAAVELVAGALGLPTDEVVGLLELLAEHSLVVARPAGPEDLRYHLLEPVAQYARSLLLGDEALRAVRAHAQVFLDLAERAATGYEGADQVLWLNHIQADEANVLVAIDRSLDGGDPETAGRITWAMWLYWWLRSQPSVGRQRANGCLTAQLSPPVLARVHLAAATMSYAGGDVPASAHHWEEAFRLGTEQQDPEIACAGRAGTGLAALGLGELDRADRCFREALPLGEQAGEKGVWLRSLIHVWLGTIRLLRSDPRGAAPEIERGLELARMRRDRLATYVALYNLAQAAISLGDHAAARAHLSEGITLSQQTHDAANLAYFLEALAVVESAEQAPDRVAVLSGAAQALRGTMEGRIYGYYLPDESLRERAEEQARTVLGDDAYDDAVDVGRGLDLEGSVVFALNP
jgi:tetratricopeptide (TPR) repeat protein